MKVLVTGGAGFIGRWLLWLLPDDAVVVVVDSLVEDVHGVHAEFPADVRARATCVHSDVRDVARWRDAAAGADVVVHLASLTGTGQSMYQPSRYIEHNVLGTSRVCEALAEMNPRPRRIILASSRAVYGEGAFSDQGRRVHPGPRRPSALAEGRWEVENSAGIPLPPLPVREDAPLQPSSIYGMTKAWQEQLVTQFAASHDVEHLVLRLQNVYGPFQALQNPYTGILGVLTSGIVRDGHIELYEDGEMTRDFVFAGDVARTIVAGIAHVGPLSRTINVASGRSVSLRELAGLIGGLLNRPATVECRGRYRLGDVRHALGDTTASEALLGSWEPVSIEEGLRQYLEWFLDQPRVDSGSLRAAAAEMEQHGLLLGRQ